MFEDLQSNASEKMGESELEEEEGGDFDDDDDWAWGDGVGKLTRCYASGGGSNPQVFYTQSCASLCCLLMSSLVVFCCGNSHVLYSTPSVHHGYRAVQRSVAPHAFTLRSSTRVQLPSCSLCQAEPLSPLGTKCLSSVHK